MTTTTTATTNVGKCMPRVCSVCAVCAVNVVPFYHLLSTSPDLLSRLTKHSRSTAFTFHPLNTMPSMQTHGGVHGAPTLSIRCGSARRYCVMVNTHFGCAGGWGPRDPRHAIPASERTGPDGMGWLGGVACGVTKRGTVGTFLCLPFFPCFPCFSSFPCLPCLPCISCFPMLRMLLFLPLVLFFPFPCSPSAASHVLPFLDGRCCTSKRQDLI